MALADWLLEDPLQIALTGFIVFTGHIFSVFLKFKGGKGVATALGVFIYLMPIPTIFAVGVFFIVLIISGYISISSMVAAIFLPIAGWLFHFPQVYVLTALATTILIIKKHQDNIKRFLSGKEPKFLKK